MKRRVKATGSLPGIWTHPDLQERRDILNSYVSTYLKEEVQAEALTRNLEGFSRFLYVAAAHVTRHLDLSKLGSTAAIARTSAQRYFEILEDTLIFFRLEAYAQSPARRLVQHPRYFVFDNGVLNALLGSYDVGSDRIGCLFENLIISQVYHLVQTARVSWRLSSFRTEHGAEVDLIVEMPDGDLAIELKAGHNVGRHDVRGLASFRAMARKPAHMWILYLGHARKRIDDVLVMPWQEGLRELSERAGVVVAAS